MISLLQLNSQFPRIPGDVGCEATFLCPLERLIVESANVQNVVNAEISNVPIDAFKRSIRQVKGDLVATSCGFLSAWQTHFGSLTRKPFVSSALLELPHILESFELADVAIVTFCSASLTSRHFAGILPSGVDFEDLRIVGLPHGSHLQKVIDEDLLCLLVDKARIEILELLEREFARKTPKCLLLECTNLPPYKVAIRERFGVEVFDVLTAIERQRAGSVKPEFL